MFVFLTVISLVAAGFVCETLEIDGAQKVESSEGVKHASSCPLLPEDGKSCRSISNEKSRMMISAIKENLASTESVALLLEDLLRNSKSKIVELEKTSCDNSLDIDDREKTDGCATANFPCNRPVASSCYDLKKRLNFNVNGIYRIWPRYLNRSVNVYCDMSTNEGGWTVIQRRTDMKGKQENFIRNWHDYINGFGNLNSEFWIGNDVIFALSNDNPSALRVELEDFEGVKRYAHYNIFQVAAESYKYQLTVGDYSGDAGDSLSYHNGQDFKTIDKHENDPKNCAQEYKGGWWYKSCHLANLNGLYLRGNHSTYANGINWEAFKGYHYSLNHVEMKIRPSSL